MSAFAAIEAEDWQRVKPLLHPYLRWTGRDGHTVRGRTKVLDQLARRSPAGLPADYELRDGQIYRWVESG